MTIFLLLWCALSLWPTAVRGSTCHVPDVYEFCSALSLNGGKGELDSQQHVQHRPGKRGAIGMPGVRGQKGEQGEQETCQHLEEKIRTLEDELNSKFELIPKLLYCGMGMRNGEIPDSAITSSPLEDHRFAAHFGRLDARVILGPSSSDLTSAGAWCPSGGSKNNWIQIDLESAKSVSGIVTQGRPKNRWGNQCWVKTFKISCGNTVENLEIISQDGVEKIFTGNNDKNTKMINKFPEPVLCRYIRLHVLSWNTELSPSVRPCLRLELLRGECHQLL